MSSDTQQFDEGRGPIDGAGAVPAPVEEAADRAARGQEALEGALDDAARDGLAAAEAAATDASHVAVTAAEATADAAEDAADAARDGAAISADALSRYNAKVIEMAQANMASAAALFAALVQARSLPEALAINADHMRRQMEALTSQGRELATLAQAATLDALQPFKDRSNR